VRRLELKDNTEEKAEVAAVEVASLRKVSAGLEEEN